MDFSKPASIIPSSNLSERIGQIAYALNVLGFLKTKKKSSFDPLKAASEFTGFSTDELRTWSERLEQLPRGILRARGVVLANPDPKQLELDSITGPGQIAYAQESCELLRRVYQGLMPELGKRLACQNRVRALAGDFQEIWGSGTYLSIQTHSLPVAKRWFWFLQELGIAQAAVVSHIPSIGQDLPSFDRQRNYWRGGLKLSEVKDSGDQFHKGSRGQIRVDLDLSLIPKKEGVIQYERITVLFGVRTTLAMLTLLGANFLD